MAFRIFQDMRGVQATYRITDATSTFLTQTLSATADVIHVDNAGKLSEPDLPNGVFGVITINGERIMYRNRNVGANTITGLMRGTAGTGASEHALVLLCTIWDVVICCMNHIKIMCSKTPFLHMILQTQVLSVLYQDKQSLLHQTL
jgi:hypothetical protein